MLPILIIAGQWVVIAYLTYRYLRARNAFRRVFRYWQDAAIRARDADDTGDYGPIR